MRKTQKPYTVIIGSQLLGFFKNVADARSAAEHFNTNRQRSGGLEVLPFKIIYEQAGEASRTVHEEDSCPLFSKENQRILDRYQDAFDDGKPSQKKINERFGA